MSHKKNASRRNFIRQASLGLGVGMIGFSNPLAASVGITNRKKLPREICVVSIDLVGLKRDVTIDARVANILARMEEVAGLQPDIICLPETFSTIWVEEKKPIQEIAENETVQGPVTSRVAAFARQNKCYIICPLITKSGDRYYNSSILIDRDGKTVGVYHKVHPVKSEIFPDQDFKGGGVSPGAFNQPVFETDFGRVGMQICYDANWEDGWHYLNKNAVDIVFFSSAFPGGRMLNYYAIQNNYHIVSSTGGDARIIDISGNNLDVSSDFIRYAWAHINLEKATVTTWPTNGQLPDLFKKYGDRLQIKVWGNTDIITIESRDADLKINQVLKEFDLMTYTDYLKNETATQVKYRPGNYSNK